MSFLQLRHMAPAAERRRGATLALPLLLVVGLYGVFYVGLDVRTTAPQVRSTPVPAVQAFRTTRIRDADTWQARSSADAAVKLQAQPRSSEEEAPAPALAASTRREQERPLLSQRTPAWDRLLKEGLYHKNSGYPRIEPQNADEQAEKAFWEDRVAHEFRDGCRRLANNTKQCLPRLIIMGQAREHAQCAAPPSPTDARAPAVQGGDHGVV